jgi:hypothetical protein
MREYLPCLKRLMPVKLAFMGQRDGEQALADNKDKYNKRMFGTIYADKKRVGAARENAQQRAREKALEKAHEIRQFEIRLYWQRSLFFWGFDVAFYVAFIAILPSENAKDLTLISLAIAFMGLCTTIIWFFIAKGSKSWVENFELHIDMLEDGITGKFHKTILGKINGFYSVSKIQADFIILVGMLWFVLLVWAADQLLAGQIMCFLEKLVEGFGVIWTIVSAVVFVVLTIWRIRRHWRTSDKTLGIAKPTKNEVVMYKRGFPELKSPPKSSCLTWLRKLWERLRHLKSQLKRKLQCTCEKP